MSLKKKGGGNNPDINRAKHRADRLKMFRLLLARCEDFSALLCLILFKQFAPVRSIASWVIWAQAYSWGTVPFIPVFIFSKLSGWPLVLYFPASAVRLKGLVLCYYVSFHRRKEANTFSPSSDTVQLKNLSSFDSGNNMNEKELRLWIESAASVWCIQEKKSNDGLCHKINLMHRLQSKHTHTSVAPISNSWHPSITMTTTRFKSDDVFVRDA